MTSVSLPASQYQWPSSPQLHPHHAYAYSQCSVSRPAPLPSPPFSFPQSQNLASAQSVTMTTVRDSGPLPSFSFPQAPEPALPDLPPAAPSTATGASSQRSKGNHRSCGNEHVADPETAEVDVHADKDSEPGPVLPPSSPSLLPEPNPGFSGQPPPGRRRHRHQRSSAVSSVDLAAVAKAFPPTAAAGGSAPTTPADMKQLHALNGEAAKSPSKTLPSTSPRSLPAPSPGSPGDSTLALSPVSSSAATLPAGHSPLATASWTATSTTTLHPSSTPTECSSPHAETSHNPSVRPKTAGAKVGSTEKKGGSNSEGKGKHKRPLSFSISTSKSATSGDPTTDVPDVPPLPKAIKGTTTLADSPGKRDKPCDSIQDTERPEESSQPDPEDKPGKKKKVRSWAGMLTRKAKKRGRKKPRARRTPTPPPILSRTNSEVGSGVDFDKDNTVVIRSLNLPNAPPPQASHQASADDRPTLETSWKPKSFYQQGAESDIFSPVIDLDAALGPFKTPDMASETPQASGFSIATKRMYSGGRRGQFVGPEMRYHRRTESAPVMPPFDRPTSGAARLSGMATMTNPDVFDEEEEDAFLAENDSTHSADDTTPRRDSSDNDSEAGLGIQVVDSATNPPATYVAPAASRSSSSSPRTIVADCSPTLDAGTSPDTGSLTAHREVTSNARNSPPWPTAEIRPATSPDCWVSKGVFASDSENTSSEVSRLATTSSSATSRQTFNSNYDGGLGGDGRHGSTDDVPSLTSTTSTATGTTPPVSSNSPRAHRDQSRLSTSAGVYPRSRHSSSTSKRSSLVSLTKLVGASLGEKSKLSYEEKAPESNPVKAKRKKHRFSRLMHFWKDKEKAPPKGYPPE